jgi:hypothetical protein
MAATDGDSHRGVPCWTEVNTVAENTSVGRCAVPQISWSCSSGRATNEARLWAEQSTASQSSGRAALADVDDPGCSCCDQASNSVLARSASIGIKRSRHVSRLIIPLDMPPWTYRSRYRPRPIHRTSSLPPHRPCPSKRGSPVRGGYPGTGTSRWPCSPWRCWPSPRPVPRRPEASQCRTQATVSAGLREVVIQLVGDDRLDRLSALFHAGHPALHGITKRRPRHPFAAVRTQVTN